MLGHVVDELAAYAEEQLGAGDRARVETHLRDCDACRRELERVRHGLALASTLSPEPMPEDVAGRIRTGMREAPVHARIDGRVASPWWKAVAAVLLLTLGVALFWHLNRPWVRLDAATAAATGFESEGRQLHDRVVAGTLPLTFVSNDERALWQWLGSEGAPVTAMRIARPEGERAQFVPLGAAVQTLAGAKTSVLSYRIDGRPVTLALALSRDVPNAPDSGWWTKRVTHRRDANGINTLTWTVGGGTYVMVSEVGESGQRACLICHTAAAFRERVTTLRP